MQDLNLPPADLRLSEKEGKTFVFDVFRRKSVLLTPEEWVRQHMLHYLKNQRGYPSGLIHVEATLKYHRLTKRADAMLYGRNGRRLLILECKAPTVPLGEEVFEQIARYNFPFGVDHLLLTNGMTHYCCRFDRTAVRWDFLDDIPSFDKLDLVE